MIRFLLALFLIASTAHAQSTRPYVDPSQLDVPFGRHHNYKQPWRAYLETRSALDFLNGMGVVLGHGSDVQRTPRLMAEAGFRAARVELGFDQLAWDLDRLINDKPLQMMRQLKQHDLRPTILLNAHHGSPGPVRGGQRQLAAPAKKGDRVVRLVDAKNLTPHYTGISRLTDYRAAEVIFTAINAETGECTLSKPLPVDLPIDKPVPVQELKFRPFANVGSPDFEKTMAGWLRYVELIGQMMKEAGIDDFDVEIWNELTFGSDFLDINRYYDPPLVPSFGDSLRPGGVSWEIARRTVAQVKRQSPRARVIWGFSNTTFFHTPIAELPAGIDGQSYHPYSTGTRNLAKDEDAGNHKNYLQRRIGPPPPDLDTHLPEGGRLTFIMTECILRHLNPASRQAKPKTTPRFFHYMTEHGVYPPEMNVTDPAVAWRSKAKAVPRAFSMWLNKGLDVMHWYCATGKWDSFGLLDADLASVPVDVPFDQVATPPMKTMRNFTRQFAGAQKLSKLTQLNIEIEELTPARKVWDAAANGVEPLFERDVFAFLPFQLTEKIFAVPIYIMTYDVTKDHPGATYRVLIKNLPPGVTKASWYDPMTDQTLPIESTPEPAGLEVELQVTDYPRVLTLEP